MASKANADGGGSAANKVLTDANVIDTASADAHHGIPKAIFFDDIPAKVEEYSAPALIDKLSSLSQKYRFFEERLVKGKDNLEEKIADSKRAIAAVSAIQRRFKVNNNGQQSKPTKTHFELSDGIYVSADIPPSDKVSLWLGANVMVEFSHDEALKLLNDNLATTETNFAQTSKDIVFLRDQLNTADVNLSRVYNHHVKAARSQSTTPRSTGTSSTSTAATAMSSSS